MPINVLFAAADIRWPQYQAPLLAAFEQAGLSVNLQRDLPPEQVDYIVFAPNGSVQDFSPYTRTKAVLNLWAGVEGITQNKTLTQPLARMVDTGLSQGMKEWVCAHVLRHHLNIDRHILGQDGKWRLGTPPLAGDRQVCVLGLGALGTTCARALADLGFKVTGWARSPKQIDGVTCLHGPDGLSAALAGAEILVLLLPATPDTENLLDAARIALMPRGAVIINPGRGTLINDSDLLAALESGQLSHATLDVFRQEPLPVMHPFWANEKITVTPHIASETRPETAAQVIAENIRRGEAGEPLLHLVDRESGY